MSTEEKDSGTPPHFIREIIEADREAGGGQVATRFPPEPNGYLHIGHAKAICTNFGLAQEFGGTCNLRFDDTNPAAEDVEYVDAIKADIRWLGWDWQDRLYFASDYFERLYAFAEALVQQGKAYVDQQSLEELREGRGSFYKEGVESPYRDRPAEESLDLLRRMRAGEFEEGECVLRARIDMAHGNMNMRDPLLYRINKAHHHRTGDEWCIYPMYDFAHGQCDAFEAITYSLCSLEFQNHRPLYDWFLDQLQPETRPRQIEFARLNLNYTVLSKRKLLRLVQEGLVDGWDDPRMPTLRGMRRRGYTAEAIRAFIDRVGVARRDGIVDVSLLEHALREHLNETSPRVMGVLRPLKVVITNMDEQAEHWFDCPYFPNEPERGTRKVPLTRELYIERDDFREEAPRKWFRFKPGKEVRLRYACLVTCDEVVKDPDTGEVTELRCTWDPESLGGNAPDGRRVKGTVHWVSARHAMKAEVRLYDRLFATENPLDVGEDGDFVEHLNPDSFERLQGCLVEPSLGAAAPGDRVQFERLGYFCVDTVDHAEGAPVFNRTITLRDSWAKLEKKLGKK